MKNGLYLKQKAVLIALAISVVVSTGFLRPHQARAEWLVTDLGNLVVNTLTSVYQEVVGNYSNFQYIYEYVLNPLAWAAAKAMLQDITNSTVNWINSGFQGSPAFVQNPEAFFQDIGDNVAGNFIAGQFSPLVNLCSPIALNVRLALVLSQTNTYNPYTCTLSQIINNVQGATINGFEAGDFSQGGWPAFVSLAEPQNSFYGAYLQAQADLSVQIQNKTALNQNLLNQGNGFLSWQKCTPVTQSQQAVSQAVSGGTLSAGDNLVLNSASLGTSPSSVLPAAPAGSVGTTYTDPGTGLSENCVTETPGSVISGALTQGLNNGQLTLIAAHNLDEIIGALAGQLVNQVLSNGLTSVSQPSANQPSYINQIQQEALNNESQNSAQLSSTLSADFSSAIKYGTQQTQTVNSSLSIAESASTTLDSALSACQNASDTPAVTQVNALIASTTAIIGGLQTEYSNDMDELSNLNQLNDEINAATSSAELNQLAAQYESLVTSMPSPTSAAAAVTENSNVQSQISSIESQATTLQNECVTYYQTNVTQNQSSP